MNIKYQKLNTSNAMTIENKLKDNDGYCPCSIIKTPNTKCMCKNFKDAVNKLKENETTICHCGLYQATKTDN